MRNRNSTKKQNNDIIPLIVQSTSSSAAPDDDNDNDNSNDNNAKARTKPRGLMRLFGGGKKKPVSDEPVIVHSREASVPIQVAAVTVTTTSEQPQSVENRDTIATTNDPDENDTAKESETPSLSEALDVESGPVDTDTLYPPENANGQRMSKTKMILSRPFGRTGLPPKLARNWVVEVSPAEWDAEENLWKYRILVQKRMLQAQVVSCSSFTTAFTWRSLRDFIWLEEALKAEFHGCLMLPMLSIAIGTADMTNAQHQVDATILKDWLGDVLNGIRGHGEVLLKQQTVDLMSSEAMESFLYRNTDPLPHPRKPNTTKSLLPISSMLDFAWTNSPIKEVKEESFVASLWNKPFACLEMDNVCTGPELPVSPTMTPRLPLGMMDCSSRALGDATTLEIQDSFVQYEPHDSSALATHSELLEAERALLAVYRKNCVSAMDKVRSLTEEEDQVGAAWRLFAISLLNLFGHEKEVESSKVGELDKSHGGLPYRKLGKQSIDELLRLMGKQKRERSTPGLRALDGMLSAYLGDLSAVAPAVNAYSEAVTNLAHLDDAPEPAKQQATTENTWSDSFRAMTSLNFVEMKKTLSSFSNTVSTAPSSTLDVENAQSQRKAFETRVLANERLLRDALTTMCRATPVRSARMAFHYCNVEIGQAALLNASALSLRAKISVADPKSIAKLKQRHVLENKEDDKTEILLVQKILNIENSSKFANSGEMGLGLDDDDIYADDKVRNLLREKALHLASERLGKWDTILALSIMEAVGIEDAEVQVEETTRDLRLVRRHAIELRTFLTRCVEAVDTLRNLILHGDPGAEFHGASHSIKTKRQEFVNQIGLAFSGSVGPQSETTSKAASPSMSILAGVRIVTDDPTGWVSTKQHGGRCKEVAMAYINSRDAEVETFLDEISSLLNAYHDRLESVESFVYMQCVGIQLEKHFSKVRADSLAAFEKKTDITTAINIANRKRLPLLVAELEAKLEAVEPKVTHTTVKETKETHLLSKSLKTDIIDLATRRFVRVRETSLERVVQLMTKWAKYEERSTSMEIKAVGNVIQELERSLKLIDVRADRVSHAFTKTKGK